MKIVINGEAKTVSEQITAQQLIHELGLSEQKLALEINEEIVPRSSFSEHLIQAGDIVEIIHAIGGG